MVFIILLFRTPKPRRPKHYCCKDQHGNHHILMCNRMYQKSFLRLLIQRTTFNFINTISFTFKCILFQIIYSASKSKILLKRQKQNLKIIIFGKFYQIFTSTTIPFKSIILFVHQGAPIFAHVYTQCNCYIDVDILKRNRILFVLKF